MSKYDPNAVSSAFQEVNDNPPKVVQGTARKFGAARARKQTIAIALSKAKKSGARIQSPKLSKGGRTF